MKLIGAEDCLRRSEHYTKYLEKCKQNFWNVFPSITSFPVLYFRPPGTDFLYVGSKTTVLLNNHNFLRPKSNN